MNIANLIINKHTNRKPKIIKPTVATSGIRFVKKYSIKMLTNSIIVHPREGEGG